VTEESSYQPRKAYDTSVFLRAYGGTCFACAARAYGLHGASTDVGSERKVCVSLLPSPTNNVSQRGSGSSKKLDLPSLATPRQTIIHISISPGASSNAPWPAGVTYRSSLRLGARGANRRARTPADIRQTIRCLCVLKPRGSRVPPSYVDFRFADLPSDGFPLVDFQATLARSPRANPHG